jgi:hypothetical protein
VITGEGDVPALDALARGERPGGAVEGVPPEPLDALPFPDRDLLNPPSYTRELAGEAWPGAPAGGGVFHVRSMALQHRPGTAP